MDLTTAPKANKSVPIGRDSSGIALFMVLSAVSVLAIVVSEFTYIAQIGQMIAYGGLDQTKAHYIAKSGLKLSLLRLKGYQQAKNFVNSMGAGAAAMGASKTLLDKIWSLPFIYPIPTNIPGMSTADKESLEKFQKESNLDGKFSALIESESSKYNLNLLLPGFAASPSPSPDAPKPPPPNDPTDSSSPKSSTPQTAASYSPDNARKSLSTYLNNIISQKSTNDTDFGSLYRDFRMDDFLDSIIAWADHSYERRTSSSLDKVQMKRAPFYSVSELHMLPNIDEDLYNLFAPALTASMSGGININSMQEATVHALVPQMTEDEVKEFFKFRDSDEKDNRFNSSDDFFKYIQTSVGAFKNNQQALTDLKQDLVNRGITLITDETQFKITVQAQAGSATRTIEAWVTLETSPSTSGSSSQPNSNGGNNLPIGGIPPVGGTTPTTTTTTTPPPDSGLKITFMKIL